MFVLLILCCLEAELYFQHNTHLQEKYEFDGIDTRGYGCSVELASVLQNIPKDFAKNLQNDRWISKK